MINEKKLIEDLKNSKTQIDWHNKCDELSRELNLLKSNPPLKFDELEEEMLVWYKKEKRWLHIERIKVVLISMNNYKCYLYEDGIPIVFEENQFFKNQVEE